MTIHTVGLAAPATKGVNLLEIKLLMPTVPAKI